MTSAITKSNQTGSYYFLNITYDPAIRQFLVYLKDTTQKHILCKKQEIPLEFVSEFINDSDDKDAEDDDDDDDDDDDGDGGDDDNDDDDDAEAEV